MTTFKNNSKYAELVFTYLELAEKGVTPLKTEDVLGSFAWNFKGGSLKDVAESTRLSPETSGDTYPSGYSWELSQQWPYGENCVALRRVVRNRLLAGKLKSRAIMGRLGTFLALTARHSVDDEKPLIYSGLHAVYRVFGAIWRARTRSHTAEGFEMLAKYTRELVIGAGGVSKVYLPKAEENRLEFMQMLQNSRFPALMQAVREVKEVMRQMGSRQAQANSRWMGLQSRQKWEALSGTDELRGCELSDLGREVRPLRVLVGDLVLSVFQEVALVGSGKVRYALSRSDAERLHQVLMSTASAILGVCAQAAVGTRPQKQKARLAVEVAERNVARILASSELMPLGDEVLVCKGYRRAYTAHLGWLAGPLCREETEVLVREAIETAPKGVLDVEGMLQDARSLDAASALNASKMFKICPAPDVSPGLAFMDRVGQIGNGNTVDCMMMPSFERELRNQILRAYIRSTKKRIPWRGAMPIWGPDYLRGEYDKVPSQEIHAYLAWEGTAEMPDVSPYDPKHWKDSGLGADTIKASRNLGGLGKKGNMITRLITDEGCPMPGRQVLSQEHVIKFFMKAEGHKDPARGIFSANLTDRQAQSWMEKAVEKVAKHHPSFMIGQEIDVKEAKVAELTAKPERFGWVPLYYSFDISGWSAKMPGEPQRISHRLWGDLYGGHLFRRATELNEGAHIYLNMDGYTGWFRNTHANLEGFNGKEMTMVLIALLSLSVSRWRTAVVGAGVMSEHDAGHCSALLFAYIDDGLSRIDLPREIAVRAFSMYKETVIDTFSKCGFSVEVSKCFPSDRFAIFLNEVYLAGRHVVHGVRAAMGISSEPTERHTSLVERVTSVSTGVRGAVMAGLNPLSACFLMAYHVFMHLMEWVEERDPVVLSVWSLCPRSWGGLGLPNIIQTFVSGSGSAFEEGVATMQYYARSNEFAKKVFLKLSRTELEERSATSILTSPLSSRVHKGYMVDSRVSSAVRAALQENVIGGDLSTYAMRLLKYSDNAGFQQYAMSVIPKGEVSVLQEQMVDNVCEAHPHSIFSAFARRLEKSMTLKSIIGYEQLGNMIRANRAEARESVSVMRCTGLY